MLTRSLIMVTLHDASIAVKSASRVQETVQIIRIKLSYAVNRGRDEFFLKFSVKQV